MKKGIATNILTATLFTTGCASIVSDSQYPVTIASNPAGASFEIVDRNGVMVHTGTTPGSVTLKSGAGYFKTASYTITYKKEGFADSVTTLTATMDGWYIGNLLFGGLIGMLIVDPATGAMYKLPESASAELAQQDQPAEGLTVLEIDALTAEQKQLLVAVN